MSDDEKPKWVDLFGIDPDWPVSVHERENHALHRIILLDLIAESRLWLSGDNPVPLGLVLDRAETRLLDTGD